MKIGLEVHVALPTKSKLFCSCSATAIEPNSAVCQICMGFPGSKPMLNQSALMHALNVSNALHCKIGETTSFVRKVYFYPDLPKSFQITQLDSPIGGKGYVELSEKKIGIRRIQLEEDPAKLTREEGYTLVDFNRSGIALLEIVTEPDISSQDELKEFLNELKSILYYLGIDIEKELKVDLNISVAGTRVEVKNVTGLRNLVDAAGYEMKRQQELLDKKQKILQETRSYDESALRTERSREKESDEEYGFIFEPDLAFYATSKYQIKKATYSGIIARNLAKKYNAKEKTILELIQFDSDALRLLESAKERYPMQSIIGAIEALKKYNSIELDDQKFDKLLAISQKGAQINQNAIAQIQKGKTVEISQVSQKAIDEKIRAILEVDTKLLKEFEKNPKSLNFIVGQVAKELKANPREVAQRLQVVLEKEYKNK